MMKRILCAILLAAFAIPGSGAGALAQPAVAEARLDTLFAGLKRAQSETEAARLSAQIWHIWMNPEDPALAVLMREALAARAAFDIDRAMNLLDRITGSWPDYAEGWNRRATLNYELGNYRQSLHDIAETLQREPRHYGALSGRALVYLALGDEGKARQAIGEALEYHPFIAAHPPLSDLIEPTVQI